MGTITGTLGHDTLTGTADADLIQGLDGSDSINGSAGDDRIEGGDGADTFDGELGDDVLLGGESSDELVDTLGGNDQLFGELGYDTLRIDRSYNSSTPTAALMDGGADNDLLEFTSYFTFVDTATLRGGSGDDRITVRGGKSVAISAGAGAIHSRCSPASLNILPARP